MKVTDPKTGKSFTSAFDRHVDAAHALTDRVKAGEFGVNPTFQQSLIDATIRFGENLSEGRAFYLHTLAEKGKPAPVASGSFNLTGLLSLFNKASAKLKRPAIVLALPTGDEVKVSLAGSQSRHAGQIMVASPEFGGAYYGRIDADGSFFAGRDASEAVRSLLSDLSTDAAACAAKHGHLTGKCCFCNRKLEDERSTSVGYGPVCASRFGLAWGKSSNA